MEYETTPLVSVSVITYRHEKFIRQCLDSILMQAVNFPYEVLVHDDASPDRTADIIREYEAKYPGIIKPIYQARNQYSQGRSVSRFNWERARGKYLAFCEGDDYWTDQNKLQKQVDFLEMHPEYIACVHRVKIIDEFGNINQSIEFPPNYDTSDYTLSDAENLFNGNGCAGHVSSLLCRNVFMMLPEDVYEHFLNCKTNGDTKLFLLLTLNGHIRRFDDTMSVYRYIISDGNSWSAQYTRISNTCLLIYNWLNELSHFSEASYAYIPDYTDYKSRLALISIYKYIINPDKNNWDIMYKLLIQENKFRLLVHAVKPSNRCMSGALGLLKRMCHNTFRKILQC